MLKIVLIALIFCNPVLVSAAALKNHEKDKVDIKSIAENQGDSKKSNEDPDYEFTVHNNHMTLGYTNQCGRIYIKETHNGFDGIKYDFSAVHKGQTTLAKASYNEHIGYIDMLSAFQKFKKNVMPYLDPKEDDKQVPIFSPSLRRFTFIIDHKMNDWIAKEKISEKQE